MGRYNADYKGIGEMLVSPEMQAAMKTLAEKVKARAEETAPFDPKGKDGHYKDSFSADSGVRHSKTSRAYGRVTNDDPAAFFIEYGTRDTPKHRTLGKAIDALNE